MKPQILSYSECTRQEWDEFVYRVDSGYVYYLYDMIALDRWINDKNRSFAIFDEDKREIVMICMLHLEKRVTEKESFYRLHSRWGYCIKEELSRKEMNKLIKKFKEHIDSYYRNYDIKSFDIAWPALAETRLPEKGMTVHPGLYFGFNPSIRYTYVIDLKKNNDELLMDLEQTTRHDINRIEKKDRYKIREAKSCFKDYEKYIELHEETYIRTGSSDAIIHQEYQRNIFFNLIPQGICSVFFLIDSQDERVVASVAILYYKNTAYYWWGSSVNDKETGINKYLLFNVIKEFKNKNENKYSSLYFETGGHILI